MTLFPYSRLVYIFEAVQAAILPQAELAKRFGVSSRTIRTDITELNDILRDYGAQIFYKRKIGYALRIDDPSLFASLIQQKQTIRTIPRTADDRIDALLLKLLMGSAPIKLDDIVEEWFISRSTLQHDMGVIREILNKYPLRLESIPHLGTKLSGDERLIRACLTDTLIHRFLLAFEPSLSQFRPDILTNIDLTRIEKTLQNSLTRYDIRLTSEGRQYLIFNCAVSILRMSHSHRLPSGSVSELDNAIQNAVHEMSKALSLFWNNGMPAAEIFYLGRQIAAQRIPKQNTLTSQITDSHQWVGDILNYISQSYNYDLRHDSKLRHDLATHLAVLVSRLQNQINTKNPLLAEIKQYYPFAYDVVVSALSRIEDQFPCVVGEDELGYLAVHIGVGLERHYGRANHVLIVTDAGNATQLMIEAQIAREFPQLSIQRVLPPHEYDLLEYVEENFVITTLRLHEKNKPVTKISAFPTSYQLEQIRQLVMQDQTYPYILERFFDERYFMIIKDEITQKDLFKKVCRKLQADGYVEENFCASLTERESIISTLLGENIALPHSLGLLALKTVVVTILAPKGIEWKKETKEQANVIFLLAISKDDYEEAMAIYDLFVTFVREKATKRLLRSRNFLDFQMIAKDSLTRSR
ncbi:BglG family transcription antiterminator [Xenorhabdus cabanillasii]|uniref:BglG family transcription antiterminator n=1 Tax=Xenorhabdus cabanillasii TaxID=351673 RepID=UPI002B414F34|nr:PRD domain-containing protein [Xenorhabdus sp. Flor]